MHTHVHVLYSVAMSYCFYFTNFYATILSLCVYYANCMYINMRIINVCVCVCDCVCGYDFMFEAKQLVLWFPDSLLTVP